MLNREGTALLGAVIGMTADMNRFVEVGDCESLAVMVNAWMPVGLKVSSADVYHAVKDRSDFGGPKVNSDILRARIDAMPVLYSARISGDIQAIVNELNRLPDFAARPVSPEDVKAAMAVRAVQKPIKVAQGAAAMVGTSRVG